MISQSPIKPTVGRVVLFTGTLIGLMGAGDSSALVPALVTRVWSDNCVNLMVMRDGHGATPIGVTSVSYAEPEEGEALPERGWHWMDYQKTKAKEEPLQARPPAG